MRKRYICETFEHYETLTSLQVDKSIFLEATALKSLMVVDLSESHNAGKSHSCEYGVRRCVYLVAKENAAILEIRVVNPRVGREVDNRVVWHLNGERNEQKLVDMAVLHDDGARDAKVLGNFEVQTEFEIRGHYHVPCCDPVQDWHVLAHRHLLCFYNHHRKIINLSDQFLHQHYITELQVLNR